MFGCLLQESLFTTFYVIWIIDMENSSLLFPHHIFFLSPLHTSTLYSPVFHHRHINLSSPFFSCAKVVLKLTYGAVFHDSRA